MFRVGQRVVCVDNKNKPGHSWVYNDSPTQGAVYTIVRITMECGYESLILAEHERHPRSKYAGYDARRFRPIVERKTSIEIFKKMLVPSKQKETAQ